MASATTRPTFSFFHQHRHQSPKPPPPSKPHLIITSTPSIIINTKHRPSTIISTLRSVDVSQDDKPLSQTDDDDGKREEQEPASTTRDEEGVAGPKLDPRRLEEKFAVLNTGIHECRSCGYTYDEAAGDPSYPVPAGLPFGKLPEDWRCPTCGAAKSFFASKSVEIAGFAQNQQFGLGANTLTSGQKALLIYGSLLFAFALFLSGYFLQ